MKKLYYLIILLILLIPLSSLLAVGLAERLAGRILLQVEEHGEAWYVSPSSNLRLFLGRPADAFALMRERGVGITNSNLAKLQVGLDFIEGDDTDQDGLPDLLESAIGTDKSKSDTDQDGFSDKEELVNNFDPLSTGNLPTDTAFAQKLSGKILLQVEAHGEAWYVNPEDLKRYFLGRPADAFNLMRNLGLGISNSDLAEISALTPNYNLSKLEESAFTLVNQERENVGLPLLTWNNDLAKVAREHSENLARENEALTDLERSCDFPLIHHEGFDFGLYNRERMNNRDIYYFSHSGENVALFSGAEIKIRFNTIVEGERAVQTCTDKRNEFENDFVENLKAKTEDNEKINLVLEEINKRESAFNNEEKIEVAELNWLDQTQVAERTVAGWMRSSGHKENILRENFNETGIGIAYINGYVITTQLFIERTDCGFAGGPCCEKEGYYPYCFVPLECQLDVCEEK